MVLYLRASLFTLCLDMDMDMYRLLWGKILFC